MLVALQEKGAAMSIVHVKQISHIALKARDLERQAEFYTDMVGLSETERDERGRVYLRCNEHHHAVVLVPAQEAGIDHFALDLGSPSALKAAAAALAHAGISYEMEGSEEIGQGPCLLLRDPDGFAIELLGGMAQVSPTYGPRAVQPRKLGHITLRVRDCRRSEEFYRDVLGFRVSDWFENAFLWMRCNPDHHGLAFIKADHSALHHLAFHMLDFSDLARQADHLMHHGYRLLYGPGRHGPGNNQFEYFRDTEHNIVEFACDMQQIWDDATYEPRVWSANGLWVNVWGPLPPEDFL